MILENYIFFLNLFTSIRIMNKKGKRKRKYTNFLVATNFYQRQSWNYSGWNFYQRQSLNYSQSNIHWRQSQEYYKQIIIA